MFVLYIYSKFRFWRFYSRLDVASPRQVLDKSERFASQFWVRENIRNHPKLT